MHHQKFCVTYYKISIKITLKKINTGLRILLLSLITFKTEGINMLSAAFYERIIGAIGEENLSGLSASQDATLIKKYKALLNKKGGDLDEITYDDLFEVWAQVK